MKVATNLDLDELLDTIDNIHMLMAFGALPDNSLITSVHPPVDEGLFSGFLVVEVSKDDARTFDHEFTGGVIFVNLLPFRSDNARLTVRYQPS